MEEIKQRIPVDKLGLRIRITHWNCGTVYSLQTTNHIKQYVVSKNIVAT